jgi:T5SS/PEP-CTERM-associated repeat protein
MYLAKYLAIVTVALILITTNVSADVTTTGDVVGNPVTSTFATSLRIGESSHGTMTIDGNGTDHDVSSSAGYICFNTGSSGTVTVTDPGSVWDSGTLFVGYSDAGTLDILNGGVVSSAGGTVGYFGPTSTATVDGAGSKWTCSGFLGVGQYGSGVINITNGGTVSSRGCAISYDSYSTTTSGVITVDGAGSKLTSTTGKNLYIGTGDYGRLDIVNGGTVDIADSIFIRPNGFLVMDVDGTDTLTAGIDFTNNGMVLLTANVGLAVGEYTPITVSGSWEGSGEYKTIGGAWDDEALTFTVSEAMTTTSGMPIDIDLSANQQVDIENNLFVDFQSGPEVLSFTATRSTSTLAGLSLDAGESVLSSWDFDITGLDPDNKTMLSYAVTGDPTDVRVWHYDASVWEEYTGSNVIVADGFATFFVDGFSSYALTGVVVPVPEPGMMVLLGTALSGLVLLRRWRKR